MPYDCFNATVPSWNALDEGEVNFRWTRICAPDVLMNYNFFPFIQFKDNRRKKHFDFGMTHFEIIFDLVVASNWLLPADGIFLLRVKEKRSFTDCFGSCWYFDASIAVHTIRIEHSTFCRSWILSDGIFLMWTQNFITLFHWF